MKGMTVIVAAAGVLAFGVGCRQEVIRETYRPLGPSFERSGSAPMELTPSSPATPSMPVFPRKKSPPWYKFEWLFGRGKAKAVQDTPKGGMPKLPPARSITVKPND